MDFSSAIGIILGFALIGSGILTKQGNIYWFIDTSSIIMVLGGTFAATLVNYPIQHVFNIFKISAAAFKRSSFNYVRVIEILVDKSKESREKGLLSLSNGLENISDNFFRKGIELTISENDQDRLRKYLNMELSNIERRHRIGQEIFLYMGAYSPAFGMIGTIIGLIIMMNSFVGAPTAGEPALDFDISKKFTELLGGMGLALVTTFWGVLFSNLVFLPMGGKLKRNSEEELMIKSIMIEGLIGIHSQEQPIALRDKLMTFVPLKQRSDIKK